MKTTFSPLSFLIAAAGLLLCGCLDLKPAGHTARYFVLSPVTNTPPAGATPMPIGVGFVKVPDYLFKDTIAVRKSNTEVEYLLTDLWAEHVNIGFQRVLAADLTSMVPASLIRLSEWRPQDIVAGIYVTVEQFDVDQQGKGVLIAWWRVVSPTGDKVLKSAQFRGSVVGPSPSADPQAATATLSALVGKLSAEIAQAVREAPAEKPAQ